MDIIEGGWTFRFGQTTTRYDGALHSTTTALTPGFEVVDSIPAALARRYPLGSRHLHAPVWPPLPCPPPADPGAPQAPCGLPPPAPLRASRAALVSGTQRALLEVMVGGQPQVDSEGRTYFAQLTPVKLLANPYKFGLMHQALLGEDVPLPGGVPLPATAPNGGKGASQSARARSARSPSSADSAAGYTPNSTAGRLKKGAGGAGKKRGDALTDVTADAFLSQHEYYQSEALREAVLALTASEQRVGSVVLARTDTWASQYSKTDWAALGAPKAMSDEVMARNVASV